MLAKKWERRVWDLVTCSLYTDSGEGYNNAEEENRTLICYVRSIITYK